MATTRHPIHDRAALVDVRLHNPVDLNTSARGSRPCLWRCPHIQIPPCKLR